MPTITGTEGDDTLLVSLTPRIIHDRGGNDGKDGSSDDQLYGGNGVRFEADWSGEALPGREIHGTEDSDTLVGTSDDDLIYGHGGGDFLYGRSGNDRLYGGTGNDTIFGEAGSDALYGEEGADQLIDSDSGDDQLFGGEGEDFLEVTRQAGIVSSILMDGEIGDDHIRFAANLGSDGLGKATLVARGGSGDDKISVLNVASAIIDGGTGNDFVQIGGVGNFTITLGEGADLLSVEWPDSLASGATSIVVTDFQAGEGGDRLDLYRLFSNLRILRDDERSLFATGTVRVVQNGADALLQINGSGGYRTLITLRSVSVADLVPENLDGYTANGEVRVGDHISRRGPSRQFLGHAGR